MGGETSVFCHDGPVVIEPFYISAAGVDHRLDRKRHPGYETDPAASLPEIRNLRIFVEIMPDSVSDKISYDTVSERFRIISDLHAC